MKLFTGIYRGQEVLGALAAGDESKCVLFKNLELNYKSMNDFVIERTEYEYNLVQEATKDYPNYVNMKDVTLLAPIPEPKQDIICLGINYLAHAEESARFKKEAFERDRAYPVYFSKRVTKATADGEGIPYNTEAFAELDYEVELAIVIGKDAKDVKKEDAKDYILGYTIVNDMSARDVQIRHKQWYFGKSMDGFTPMGPVIATAEEFEGIPNLKLTSKVNGELRQDSNTSLLQFDIPYVIEELSRGMTLKAGTIIATGTPAGVGMGFTPPKFLKVGDVIECEIEGIGVLRNPVVGM